MLDFLDEREAFPVLTNFEIHQNIFGSGVVDQVFEFFDIDFEVLRLGFSAVNDGRNPACAAEFFDFTTTNLRPWKCG
jgi:hypothetical protein